MKIKDKKNISIITQTLAEHHKLFSKIDSKIIKEINTISKIILRSLFNKKKIMLIGNGGSAADCQHLATEFTIQFKKKRKAIPAIALTTDSSALTACGNDFSFNEIFSRQIEALGNSGDILIAISTSGNSKNIIAGLKIANKKRITTIGFLGKNGGKAKLYSKHSIIADSFKTSTIQEFHIFVGQLICEIVDEYFK